MDIVLPAHDKVIRQHKSVPRWLRMALRLSIMVGLVSLPALAIKDPSFEALHKHKPYGTLFVVMGLVALPIWEPNLGNIVLAFTLLTPVALAAIWLAYGLFLGCSHIIFMMGACVVVTFITFFVAELLSMPVALLSVFALIFMALANMHVQSPALAFISSVVLSIALLISAVIATMVSWLVFPEFCVDEVIRSHHEGLEHLLHLAHYAFGSQPPALTKHVIAMSKSAGFGEDRSWQQVLAAAGEQVPHNDPGNQSDHVDTLPQSDGSACRAAQLQKDYGVLQSSLSAQDSQEFGGLRRTAGSTQSPVSQAGAVLRSWYRIHMAFAAGVKAEVGAKAEVVLAAVAHKRLIIPCTPLLPCSRGQLNDQALLALRHIGVSTALDIYMIYNAMHPLVDTAACHTDELTASAEWLTMRSALLAALQELINTFPMDYYPISCVADRQKIQDFSESVQSVKVAWKSRQLQLRRQQHIQGEPVKPAAGQGAGQGALNPAMQEHVTDVMGGDEQQDVGLSVHVVHTGAATAALAQVHDMMVIGLLSDLAERLELLCTATSMVSKSILKFKCC